MKLIPRVAKRDLDRWDDLFAPFFTHDVWRNFFREPATEQMYIEPALDLKEEEKQYLVSLDIPGLDTKDIKITSENNTLSIEANRKREEEKTDETYHIIERFCGSIKRAIRLPKDIDADNIKAEYKNGVLNVTVPKSEKTLPKQIAIKVS